MIREINSEETGKLYECLEALAEHHNKVSVHFKRRYPVAPSGEKIIQFQSEEAIHLYEKYGFRERSVILTLER